MIVIIMIAFVGLTNSSVQIGKRTDAYTTKDTVFASGMDLLFESIELEEPYGTILLDVSDWENHGEVTTIKTLEYTDYDGNTSIYGAEWR